MAERRLPRRARRPARPLYGAALALAIQTKVNGDACEALVRRALRDESRPWWILKVRRARRHEDRHGVDFVVQLDVGRVFLQVKRSQRRADQLWLAEHVDDPRPIGLVVARETEAVEVVFGRALGALILLRERLEAEVAVAQGDQAEAG